ncbi:metallophosphoesterase [Pontibacillus halophilus JSM 076056 = DSM 19796]|uniref:Metallophosphoesterase n=1 Tax=Pontibacillus halophilus JSM 076056 = DSM 19796 TaxID=1385510 RepID=A0A0A5GKR7_9BACI|nr:metallophosphoesterase [Pontibacillus halophilus JSM 076056 = DSM 19796]
MLPTSWLKVERVEWDTKAKKTIVQISDLHIRHLRVPMSTIERTIKDASPDYIFLTGDYIDKHPSELPKLESFLKMIERVGVETYAVLGNHDRHTNQEEAVTDLLKKYGVTVLKNEYVEKEDVVIVGIDDYALRYHNVPASFNFSNEEDKDVLVLTHDPDVVTVVDQPFHFLVSGHLHGKQVNVPFLFKLKDMGQLAKQGVYQGQHPHSKGTFYISKGIGQSALNIRFFVRSEMTIHNLNGKRT